MQRKSFALFAAFSLVLLITSNAMAVLPVVSYNLPLGVKRGADTEVEFIGTRLDDIRQILFYAPGISLKSIAEERKANRVKVTLSVTPDCELGLIPYRLVTETGIAPMRMIAVGAFDETEEVEPNSEFSSPQAIAMNSTTRGVVLTEDVDYFVVEAKAGERISAEVEGLRIGSTVFDPSLAILDEKRFQLARSDDAVLLQQDCICSVVAPADGKYIIQLQEASFGGNGNCRYRLHVGNFPRPKAVYPAGGKAGEPLKVRWIGDPSGDFESEITIPESATETFAAFAQNDQGIAASPNVMRVNDLQNFLEAEPNDELKAPNPTAAAPLAINGIIEKPGDIDYFKFSAKKGEQFDIRVYARTPIRSPLDSVLRVRDINGKSLGSNDDSGGPDSYFKLSVPADGEYLVSVNDHLKAGGPTYVYRIEITPVSPSLTMSPAEKARYVPTIAPAPQNNRVGLMMNVSRSNVGGEVTIAGLELPAGMKVIAPAMPANRSTIPVLFETTAEAPLGASLADMQGTITREKDTVVGHLNQRHMIIRGGNNSDVWGHNAKRLAVAVTKPAPYSIEIVQPKVPIVRSGSMQLKIVAKRDEKFTGPISVRMLYNPPGVGSSSSLSIPEGKNEVLIPITANGGAAIGQWPIAIRALAGSLETASPFAQLDIAEPFIGLTFVKSACEQGKETTVLVKIEKKIDFEGVCKVKLLGLPAKTSTPPEPIEITKDTTEATFKVKVEADAKPAKYTSLVCQCEFTKNGEPIVCTFGGGELRVDKPLPPKKEAPKPKPKTEPKKPEPKKEEPAAKPLSRLEQLRLERKKALEEAGK